MKKTIAVFVLALALAVSGCGNAESGTAAASTEEVTAESSAAEQETQQTETEASSDEEEATLSEDPYEDTDTTPIVEETVEEAGIDSFVTVGEYKGLELTRIVENVTDEYIDNYINGNLQYAPLVLPDDAVLEDGLVANIDYVGRIDGEAFDGGTGNGYDLTIGSHSFIDTFEEQLIGHKKGDEVLVKVTFPDDYFAEDLAGKEAEFTVTVNQVKEILTEATDEWVAANTDYKTLAEYREFVRVDMQQQENDYYESQMRQDAWNLIRDSAQFERYPKDLYDKYETMVWTELEGMADMYGMNLEELMENFGVTKGYVTSEAKSYTQVELISRYIVEKEGKSFDDPEVAKIKDRLIASNGFASEEDAIAQGVSQELIDFSVRNAYAMDYVIKYAVITETEATEEELSEAMEAEEGNG